MASRLVPSLRSNFIAVQPFKPIRATLLPSALNFSRQASSSSSFGLRAPPPPAHPLSYKDAAIPYRTVQLVDPTTNHLLDPQPLRSVLTIYDQSTHTLVLVNIEKEIPIVKLIDKVEERKKARESEDKAKLKKKLSIEEKEVQISWQSAKGDLLHKLNLAKTLLEKGDCRIQIIFANRKKSESIGDKQKLEIINWFDEELEGQYGKKWKDDDKNKGLWILYYNPLDTNRNQAQSKVKEQDIAKKKEKEEKKDARRKKEEERRAKSEARAAAKAENQEEVPI